MSTSWLPGLLHRAERATPAPLRRLMKRLAPSFVSGAHRLILSADALIGSDASESDLLDGILTACLERVPRPEPNWEAGGAPEGP